MIRRLVAAHLLLALAVAVCAAIPVAIAIILQSLWRAMTADLGQIEAMRLVVGMFPTAFYVISPGACVLVIAWLFHANSRNFTLPVMYAAGFSVARCATPAIVLAVSFTAAAILNAWVVAPRGITLVEDVKHLLRHNVDVNALRAGRFHEIRVDGGVVNFSFRRHAGHNRFQDVVFAVKSKALGNMTVVAKSAIVEKRPTTFVVTFKNGNGHANDPSRRSGLVAFETYELVIPRRGGAAGHVRTSRYKLEMSYRELAAVVADPGSRQRDAGFARSELTKRSLTPFLNLTHAMLATGLLFLIGPTTGRGRSRQAWIPLGLIAAHALAMISIDVAGRSAPLFPWLLGGIMAVEFAVGVALLVRASRTLDDLATFGRMRRLGAILQRRAVARRRA